MFNTQTRYIMIYDVIMWYSDSCYSFYPRRIPLRTFTFTCII